MLDDVSLQCSTHVAKLGVNSRMLQTMQNERCCSQDAVKPMKIDENHISLSDCCKHDAKRAEQTWREVRCHLQKLQRPRERNSANTMWNAANTIRYGASNSTNPEKIKYISPKRNTETTSGPFCQTFHIWLEREDKVLTLIVSPLDVRWSIWSWFHRCSVLGWTFKIIHVTSQGSWQWIWPRRHEHRSVFNSSQPAIMACWDPQTHRWFLPGNSWWAGRLPVLRREPAGTCWFYGRIPPICCHH